VKSRLATYNQSALFPAVALTETKSYHSRRQFCKVPQTDNGLAGVAEYHEDSYALEVLMTYLSDGKRRAV